MDDTGADKRRWRDELRDRLAAMSPEEIRSRSEAACGHLMATEAFRHAQALMLYMPLPGEVDICQVMLRCFQDNRIVCIPKVDWEHRRMSPVQIHSFDEQGFAEDRYGVKTPTHGVPIPIEMLDLVVVPGLGYDTDGYRIGRGAGFYDRFLARAEFSGRSMGLCFDSQIIDHVPRVEHDMRTDLVVTERRVLGLNPRVDRGQPH